MHHLLVTHQILKNIIVNSVAAFAYETLMDIIVLTNNVILSPHTASGVGKELCVVSAIAHNLEQQFVKIAEWMLVAIARPLTRQWWTILSAKCTNAAAASNMIGKRRFNGVPEMVKAARRLQLLLCSTHLVWSPCPLQV